VTAELLPRVFSCLAGDDQDSVRLLAIENCIAMCAILSAADNKVRGGERKGAPPSYPHPSSGCGSHRAWSSHTATCVRRCDQATHIAHGCVLACL
jgi:hypothetical protein